MTRVSVLLITSNRSDLTERTVKSFRRYNDPKDFGTWFHVDDASADRSNLVLAGDFGFKTVIASQRRMGCQWTRAAGIRIAARDAGEAGGVLVLENDWESVRPVPLGLVDYAFQRKDVYAVRMYHRYKERDPTTGTERRACGKFHYGKGKDSYNPHWTLDRNGPEPCEFGDIHWGAPPTITRPKPLCWLHENTVSESHIRKKCARMDDLHARVTTNVFYHIGYERTEGFKR